MKALVSRVLSLPPIAFAVRVQARYSEDGAGYLASALTYHGFLSVFPLLLIAVSVIGFALEGDALARAQWADRFAQAFPGMRATITDILTEAVSRKGSVGVLGLLGLIWTGTGIVRAGGFALGRIFGFKLYSNFFKNNLWALGSLISLGGLFLLSVGATSVASSVDARGPVGVALAVAAWLVGLLMDFMLFMFAYRILTQRQGPPFAKLLPGALFAAVAWSTFRVIAAWYVARSVANAEAVYGTLGVVIGLYLVLSVGARVFLYGAEINALVIRGDAGAAKEEEDETMMQRDGKVMERNGDDQNRSTISLVRDIASDTGTLVRKEVELAKQEVVEAVSSKARGAAGFAVAGIAGIMALVFVGLSVAAALDGPVPAWAARLIVAGFFVGVAAIGVALGMSMMRKSPLKPEKTVETVKEDVQWAKAQLKR